MYFFNYHSQVLVFHMWSKFFFPSSYELVWEFDKSYFVSCVLVQICTTGRTDKTKFGKRVVEYNWNICFMYSGWYLIFLNVRIVVCKNKQIPKKEGISWNPSCKPRTRHPLKEFWKKYFSFLEFKKSKRANEISELML